MSMNIGPMLRALIGDGQPADGSRALELRIGQIVRGVLMEMLDNHEALMNINGVQVRAKLEAELPLGRSTLLQVQPGGSGGAVTLKPLPDASDAMPEDGLKDVLKSFGLPEQKWAMELMRGLKRDGYQLGRETAAFFNSAAALKPANADVQTWMGAADVAFRRGLSPTETTLASLRQALFGPPLQQALADFESAVTRWLGESGVSDHTAALGQRLQNLFKQGAAVLAQGQAQLTGQSAAPEVAAPLNDAASIQKAAEQGRTEIDMVQSRGEGAGRAVGAPQSQAFQPSVPGHVMAAETDPPASGLTVKPAAEDGAADKPSRNQPQPAEANRTAAQSAAEGVEPSAPKQEAPWIGRFLQWLGAGHEHRLLHPAEGRLPGEAGLLGGPGPALTPGDDPQAPAQEARHADTLKGALLALAAHEEVPPALREAAQTLAGQVTGQQLLLSSERNPAAPFSHMTLFVPMKGADGETTAAVHVQTRRNRRGEWDIDNCRLLFDLRMRHVGATVVDVQVVDRIVSLKLLNDFPGMSDLIEQARPELAAGMSAAGFQLLSLSVSPLPQWKDDGETHAATQEPNPAVGAGYAAKPYKGVDFRV
ncbi:hypothetical protein SD71_14635 [Cohnella kolymensis]|uniref:Flagellar hook-length control protein-like C-terminal domain-containing protein n=1 Tax=Cohnella kolymensis TaxID=1590652 RepID=A0ABR5A2N9_9BACL|nr:hypothetical protein [Cohnella kolymensis]KIL35271.1 hypothetical protein SD71_14635 [Cohnella kolymensis]